VAFGSCCIYGYWTVYHYHTFLFTRRFCPTCSKQEISSIGSHRLHQSAVTPLRTGQLHGPVKANARQTPHQNPYFCKDFRSLCHSQLIFLNQVARGQVSTFQVLFDVADHSQTQEPLLDVLHAAECSHHASSCLFAPPSPYGRLVAQPSPYGGCRIGVRPAPCSYSSQSRSSQRQTRLQDLHITMLLALTTKYRGGLTATVEGRWRSFHT